MEGRDILILFICATAILISFPPTGHIKFTPTWQIKVDTSNYRNGNSPLDHEKLPPPVVTDLDQDGFNDIVYVTTNYEIKVVDAAEIYDLKLSKVSHKTLPELDVTFSSSLLPKLGIRYGRKPIALKTGFIDDPFTAGRKQVIVVLTESWLVMCFDAELNLLWESNPVPEMDQNLYHSEAAIEIISTPVRNGDRGLVIIGGRTIKKDIKLDHEHADKKEFEADEEQLLTDVKEEEEEVDNEVEVNSEEDHFSYYAFDGESGDLRWSHEPGDFENVPSAEEFERFNFGEFVDEALKKFLTRNALHLGEVRWYEFASDVLEKLPYRWRIREDTSLTADRFDKRRQTGGSFQSQSNIYDPFLFNQNDEPINKPPNVIVARNSAGIEVIHLYSGRPLTTLKFSPGSLFDDINGDNVIDKIDAISDRASLVKKGEVTPTLDKCFAIVTSGNPSTQILFEGSICDVLSALQKIKFGFEIFDAPKNEKVEVVPPLSIKSGGKTNLIFLVSSGKITSYDSEGAPNWQISTDVKWNNKLGSKKKKSAIRRFPKLDSFRELGGFPTLEVFSVESNTLSSQMILAVGSSTLALINPEDGVIFTESHTPGIINAPPILSDWDTDGYNDIIFSTANGFYGWRLESTTSSFLYPIISIVFIVALLIIGFTRGKSTGKKPVPSDNSQFRL